MTAPFLPSAIKRMGEYLIGSAGGCLGDFLVPIRSHLRRLQGALLFSRQNRRLHKAAILLRFFGRAVGDAGRAFPSPGRGHRFNPYCAAIKMIPLSWHSLQHPAAPAEAAI
jgi:hypothetical protein